MRPKSPLTKKLVGGQHRLPAELKQEILNSPAKMKDLSGDGKITKKDVLIGRGVLKKDSPAKIKKPGKNMDPGFTRDSHGNKAIPLPSPSPKLPEKPPKNKPTKRKILKRK